MKRKDWIRAGALLAAFAVLFWVLCLPAAAAQENSHTNTGKQSEDMIATAESQLYYTAPASGAKYNVWFEEAGAACDYAWCQTFLTWCADQAGISTDVIPRESTVSAAISFYETEKRFQKSLSQGGSYTPRRGDIVYYSANGKRSEPTHVGLITAVEDGTLYTIEGNVSNQVLEQQHDLDAAEIIGYACPLYNDLPNVIVPEKPAVTVEAAEDNTGYNSISWGKSEMAQKYCLEIRDAAGRCVLYQETTRLSYRICLDTGKYTVQVTAWNSGTAVSSELVSFYVPEQDWKYYEAREDGVRIVSGCLVQEGDSELATQIQWEGLNSSFQPQRYVVQIFAEGDTTGMQIPVDVKGSSQEVYAVEQTLPLGRYVLWVMADFGTYSTLSSERQFTVSAQLPANGDVNGDGLISAADAVEMQRYLLGETSDSLRSWKRSDLSGDGVVNGLDFAALRQALLTALPETPTLQVRPGPPDDVTEFTWDVCQRAAFYIVEVMQQSTKKVVFRAQVTDARYLRELPAGSYIAQVTAVRKDGTFPSDLQYFKVSALTTIDPDPAAAVTVMPGDANTPTKISWEPALWADAYAYAIWQDVCIQRGETKGTSVSVALAPGNYRFCIRSQNESGQYGGFSEMLEVQFTVPEQS